MGCKPKQSQLHTILLSILACRRWWLPQGPAGTATQLSTFKLLSLP